MLSNLLKYLTQNQQGIEIAITAGTFIISVITLIGALISGFISVRNIISDRRHKLLADFITVFSDENTIRRLGGINGLPRYSKYLFKELFFLCCIENETIIRELMYDVLQKHSPHKKNQCIQINDFLVNYFLQGDYPSEYLDDIKKEESIIKTLKSSQTDRRIQFELDRKNPSFLFKHDYSIDCHLLLSSKILASAITKSFYVKLNGNLILQSNMYGAKWVHNSIQNCVLVGNIMRHMLSLSTKYNSCHIKNNNFYDSRLYKTHFNDCTMSNVLFRSSHFNRTAICGGGIRKANFDKSSLKKCQFIRIKYIFDSSWSGCTITDSKYENLQIISNKMKGTDFISTEFVDIGIYRNDIVGSFTKCKFKNVKWGGSIIKSTQFVNCTFENADFLGATLSQSKFIRCQFINTDLKELRSSNNVFEHCTQSTGNSSQSPL